MNPTYQWPVPPGYSEAPLWTGRGFRIGDNSLPLLSYTVGQSGWTDDLTTFHEDNAGSDHFIDRASRSHTLRQVKRYAAAQTPTILEVGCSSGFCLGALAKELPHARLIGADYVR